MNYTYNSQDHTIEEVDTEEGNTTAAVLLDSISPDKALSIVASLNNEAVYKFYSPSRFTLIFPDHESN